VAGSGYRKYMLFLGNVDAGSRAAMLSTIMAGAKCHRPEPWADVKDVGSAYC
jgi:transposase